MEASRSSLGPLGGYKELEGKPALERTDSQYSPMLRNLPDTVGVKDDISANTDTENKPPVTNPNPKADAQKKSSPRSFLTKLLNIFKKSGPSEPKTAEDNIAAGKKLIDKGNLGKAQTFLNKVPKGNQEAVKLQNIINARKQVIAEKQAERKKAVNNLLEDLHIT